MTKTKRRVFDLKVKCKDRASFESFKDTVYPALTSKKLYKDGYYLDREDHKILKQVLDDGSVEGFFVVDLKYDKNSKLDLYVKEIEDIIYSNEYNDMTADKDNTIMYNITANITKPIEHLFKLEETIVDELSIREIDTDGYICDMITTEISKEEKSINFEIRYKVSDDVESYYLAVDEARDNIYTIIETIVFESLEE